MTEDELMEMLRDLEAAGQNQAVDYMPEWNKANKQALDLRTQIFAAFAEMRAERDLLREAVEYPPEWLFVDTATPYVTCQWCHAVYKITGYTNPPEADHKPDCLRQRALAGKEAQPTNEAAPGAVINTDIEEG